jgi:hypothetical protein
MRIPARWTVVALAVSLLLGLSTPATAAPQGARATYAAPVLLADGHVDAPATISRVQAMNANAYAFLVRKSIDWGDLVDFLPVAQAAGVKVWVYLVPPSECPGGTTCADYVPYKKDYAAWGRAIGTLSAQYPVLTAWAMDDFDQTFFTPAYTTQIRNAGRAVQPTLEFYPVVYAYSFTQAFVDKYAATIDSVIFPFRDDPNRNTLVSSTLRAQLDQFAARMAAKNRKLILMVYASTLSSTTVPPDVEYVETATTVGMEYMAAGKIAGVIEYALPLTPGRPQNSDVPISHSGDSGLLFTVQAEKATAAGDYASASTTVALDAGSTSCRMVLWHTDNRPATSPSGYHQKQAFVGGVQVWTRDVASEDTAWYTTAPVDITSHLTNGSATLLIRLYEKAGVSNYAVTARFDDVTLTGCHISNPTFETAGGWTYARRGGAVLVGRHTYLADYSSAVLEAVARHYAA